MLFPLWNIVSELLLNFPHLNFTFQHIRVRNRLGRFENLNLVVFSRCEDDPRIVRVPAEIGNAVRKTTVHEQSTRSVSA